MSIRERIGVRVLNNRRSRSPDNAKSKGKSRPVLNSVVHNAGKSLLLRAVAEAQKSTSQGLNSELKKRQRENITIRVPIRENNMRNEEEYVPKAISGRSESEAEYHPSNRKEIEDDDENVVFLNNNDVDLDDLDMDTQQNQSKPHQSPKFIDSLEFNRSHIDENSKSSKSPTPPPVIKRNKRRTVKDRIGVRPIDQLMPSSEEQEQRPQKRQQSFEEENEDVECESQRAYNKAKRTRVSPITFDLTDEENDDGKSRSSSCDRLRKKTPTKEKSVENEENGEEHAKRIRLETSRSFDHVPACKKLIFLVEQNSNFLHLFFSAKLSGCCCTGFIKVAREAQGAL